MLSTYHAHRVAARTAAAGARVVESTMWRSTGMFTLSCTAKRTLAFAGAVVINPHPQASETPT